MAEATHQAMEQLRFTGLAAVAERPALALTLAQRKRLEFAKSLAMKPRVLMLDEVNAGLNPVEVEDALALIRKVAETGVTIVLIEHLLKVVRLGLDPGRRPASRQADRRGHAGRRPARPAGGRGLSRRQVRRPVWSRGLSGAAPLLAVADLEAGYGDVQVLWGLSLSVEVGEIVCMVGSNGAGKSTFMRCISGLVAVRSGTVTVAGTRHVAGDCGRVRHGRHRPRAGGTTPLLGDERARQSADGRLSAHRQGSGPGGSGAGLRHLPDLGRAPSPGRRHAVRRRAADVRHRPRHDGPAAFAADRRAVARASHHGSSSCWPRACARSTATASRSCWSSRT